MNRRIINVYAFLAGLCLAVIASSSWAVTAPTGWFILDHPDTGSQPFGSGQEACTAAAVALGWGASNYTQNVANNTNFEATATVQGWSVAKSGPAGYCQYFSANVAQGQYCASGTASGVSPNVQCSVCPAGTVDNGGVCVATGPCDAGAGTVVSSGMYDLGTDDSALPPSTTCDGQCVLAYTGSGVVARQLIGGVYHYFSEGNYTATAMTCSTADALDGVTSMPAPSCDSATQQQGTVNGKFVCLDKSTTKTTTTTPVVTNPDGSTTQTTTTSDSGTKMDTITTTTTAPDGTVSTSTTTAPTPGTGSDTPFCESNPTDPSCTKDDIPWGTIPEQGVIPTHEVPVTTAYTVIGGEGFCPADSSVDFMGQSITWSYGPICTFAEAIRPLVIALAWLSFGFIIVGGLGRAK